MAPVAQHARISIEDWVSNRGSGRHPDFYRYPSSAAGLHFKLGEMLIFMPAAGSRCGADDPSKAQLERSPR